VLVDRGCEIKLLLDEDLSPWVALRLRKVHFVDAVHVRDRGRLGLTDREVLEFAFGQDRILVTGNVLDFVRLAKAREIHCGIVFVLDGALRRADQLELLLRVRNLLAIELTQGRDMVNRVLRISADGTTEFLEMPPS
jgi:predicted nuclease of predicted toxin-antitoxin system